MIKYKFYATLLDKYESYINSSRIYQQYYGFAENPSISEEEFEKKQFQSLIDTINRVPFESEAASKGTAFNEMIDCIIENRKSNDYEITSNKVSNTIIVKDDKYIFDFPLDISLQIASKLKGAITQQFCEGNLSTKYGDVLLYGYIDELMPFKVVDIKTTSKYNAFKFRHNWQHIAYPFCLIQSGILISEFEYLTTDFKKIWSETYNYNPQTDLPKLIQHCESLIEFIEQNKHLISNKKIFALDDL